jgi:hypothetical protein
MGRREAEGAGVGGERPEFIIVVSVVLDIFDPPSV